MAGLCRISTAPIDPHEAMRLVQGPDRGAVAAFAGTVRDRHEGRRVTSLEYQAYVPMAERILEEIAAEAASRFGTPHVLLWHRIGRLEIGETSVLVVVAAEHRREALAACAFAIDQIKEKAPIWKKEFGEGGVFWIEGPGSCAADR
jgi:molybdopterin synthase catalytic subunit